jgi:NitT/TauT family transport system permease protein
MKPFSVKPGKAFSPEHRAYIKRERNRRLAVLGVQIMLLAVFIGLWELLARLGAVDTFYVSSPARMWALLLKMSVGEQTIYYHMGVTLMECIAGFVVATAGGTLIAVILWRLPAVRKILEPYIVVLNSLPKIALGPLLIIWLGLGYKPIIGMTVLICIIVTVISVLNGFCAVNPDKVMLLKSMGARQRQILFKLVLPSSVPGFLSVCKMNIGLAWVGAIMGEYIVSKAGLGYLIDNGRMVFNTDVVMLSIVLLCIMATVMYLIISFLEKILCRRFF